jgi:hypothetical protein
MKVDTVPIKVERSKGLFNNLGEPESLLQLGRFRRDAGLTTEKDNQTFAPFLEPQGGTIDFLKRKAKELREILGYYDIHVIGTTRAEITISAYELHCPHVEGTSATLEAMQTEQQTEDCSLEIFGVGGGDEFKTSLGYGEGLETEGSCAAIVYSIPAIYELCEVNTPDGRKQRFVRLERVEENSKRIVGMTLSGEMDACQVVSFDEVPGSRREPITVQFDKGKYSKTFNLEVGWSWKSEAKVKLEQFGLEVGTSFLIEKTAKTELKYSLANGEYIAYKPQNQLKWLWRVVSPVS